MQQFRKTLLIASAALLVGAGAGAMAQNVSMSEKSITVKNAIEQLKKQSGYNVVFSTTDVNTRQLVTLNLQNVGLAEALNQILKGQNDLTYEIKDKVIVIRRKEQTGVAAKMVNQQVKGVILDDNGEPIIGATIREKGTNSGTVSDMEGNFALVVSSSNAMLEISSVGYKTNSFKVGNRTVFNVKLSEDTQAIEEVVVVGYGSQKKVNMTGAVASVNMDELTKSRPITNVSQALGGMAAGVSVTSGSNAPGDDNASILVRGQGTLNTSSPLIIIDGVESSINSVNPQDIESVSVLKDAASAAIYGSRAANGVILITTKAGKAGTIKVDYNGYVSFQSIRKTLTPVSNYADYMELINEGYSNSGLATPFSTESIETWRNDGGRNALLYPNTDWIDETFKSSVSTNHVVSLSGGTDKLRFYASMGYVDNPGVMYNTGYTRYNGRFSLTADVKPWLTLGVHANGYVGDRDPGYNQIANTFTYASATTPGMVFRAPDGRFGAMNNTEDDAQSANNNPLVRAFAQTGKNRTINLRPRFTASIRPLKGLSVDLSYSYESTDNEVSRKPVVIEGWNFLADEKTYTNKAKSYIYNYNSKVERFFNDAVVRYENKFIQKQFDFKVMAGASQELYRSKNFGVTRYDLLSYDINAINGATGESSSSGTSQEWAMRSFFGRLNLGWQDKYLVEFNLRADGSSRFRENNRWGYFPSASVAWRLDQEKFMQGDFARNLSNLKLRASYGALGNNSVGNYSALSLYNGGYNYALNGNMVTGVASQAIANANLTWERTNVFDVGVDFGFFGNRLTGTIDYFNKRTTDILINLPAPDVHGEASLPKQNSATVTNRGVELSLAWQDKINDFSYGISGNFTYVTNKVNKFKGTSEGGRSISNADLIWEGYSINSQYLLQVDRLLQTDEDMRLVQQIIDNAPVVDGKKVNPFAAFGTPQKGDLLYKDLNGDGIIDNNDKAIVSDGPNAKYLLGLNLNASWKGFDFSALIQGAFGLKTFWRESAYNTPTVRKGYQINKEIADGRWTEGRTDATYPRLLEYSDTRNTQLSDFYLANKAYLKIRNIQLGYSLPKSVMNYLNIDRVRFYVSLENFITLTSYKGFDPEVSGMNYPTMKQAVLGLNVTF